MYEIWTPFFKHIPIHIHVCMYKYFIIHLNEIAYLHIVKGPNCQISHFKQKFMKVWQSTISKCILSKELRKSIFAFESGPVFTMFVMDLCNNNWVWDAMQFTIEIFPIPFFSYYSYFLVVLLFFSFHFRLFAPSLPFSFEELMWIHPEFDSIHAVKFDSVYLYDEKCQRL